MGYIISDFAKGRGNPKTIRNIATLVPIDAHNLSVFGFACNHIVIQFLIVILCYANIYKYIILYNYTLSYNGVNLSDDNAEESGIWALYGFKTNPFSTSPLLVKGGLIPIDCFIGRKTEFDSLVKMFHSSGGSRGLVCGDVGVGKTTLVNVARAEVISKGFFSPFEEIGVQKNWDADLFILNTLYRIYATLAKMKQKPISEENYKKLQTLLELNNNQISGLGLNIGIIGANISHTTTSAQNEYVESEKSLSGRRKFHVFSFRVGSLDCYSV